jgi:ribosomal protein S18 acetylase RimI-like enzyme
VQGDKNGCDAVIKIVEKIPDIEDHLRLRAVTGMSPRSRVAAERGLPKSLFATIVLDGENTIGIGRVVGDGGLNFEIVDIAVDPGYQGQGLSRKIMEAIMAYLDREAPQGCYISLIADVPEFYEKFGFKRCAPKAEGMFIRK